MQAPPPRWIELTEAQAAEADRGLLSQVAKAVLPDGRKAGPQHMPSGINAAARELGMPPHLPADA